MAHGGVRIYTLCQKLVKPICVNHNQVTWLTALWITHTRNYDTTVVEALGDTLQSL
jgi:hypothetical protein